jgi:hypothetical protein
MLHLQCQLKQNQRFRMQRNTFVRIIGTKKKILKVTEKQTFSSR